jgi:hypothetical protein
MENEKGGTSSTHKRCVMLTEFQSENLKVRAYRRDLGIAGRVLIY